MRIHIHPRLIISNGPDHRFSLVRGIRLLAEIERLGNLAQATRALGMSYRSAWGLLQSLDLELGGPVVIMTKGKGSELTHLGERLVWSQKLIHARFDPLLESMATEVEAEIRQAVLKSRQGLKMFASHGFAIAALNAHLLAQEPPVELSYRGSLEAVGALARGTCDIAGFHVPLGVLEQPVVAHFAPLMRSTHRLIHLATRRQGIMVAKDNPKAIWQLTDLLRPGLVFVNRQLGSGTRLILDLLLEQAQAPTAAIRGFDNVELTHAAVAAYIASGKADAGLGVEAAARQFGLDFVPLVSERYFFLCDEATLHHPQFAPIVALLQTNEFKSRVNTLPGYGAEQTGSILTVKEAFDFVDVAD
ncbi:MAG: helix-turn-helix transcriptional regulator [Herminiimonas sp.]|nr:helix-turn-helix transcriptional regulator [Herminiimonas sp.]